MQREKSCFLLHAFYSIPREGSALSNFLSPLSIFSFSSFPRSPCLACISRPSVAR